VAGSNIVSTHVVVGHTDEALSPVTNACNFFVNMRHNKSLDASGGSVFLNLIGPAMLD
jgi:hypothetical protein